MCEFIEDCEHTTLATRVLHLLGREGPSTQNPSRYIRFIYNRVILETTQVRAASVTALAKFGAQCPQLRPSIEVLLKRCLLDTDDEVRDRATFYLAVLRKGNSAAVADYILNALQVILTSLTDICQVSVVGLERALEQYVKGGHFEKSFDLKQVPVAAQPITAASEAKKSALSVEAPIKKEEKVKATRQDIYSQQIAAIPQFAHLGPLFRSAQPVELTEAVTEYNVSLIKHTFNEHVLLQVF